MKKVILFFLYIQELGQSSPILNQRAFFTYSIPESRSLKRIVGYNEDTYLNFTELTTKYNYLSEEHTVITEDGYVLKLFRIPSTCKEITKQLPVILMHGIYDSSDMWILSGPNSGLGYILADECYDVWAANHRGNRYSRKHISLDPNKDKEFWNFSFDEHGTFDVPAIIDYITDITNQSKVFYIGHSQGTTDYFITMSLRPEYNSKIQLSIHLAPVAWFKYVKSPIPKSVAELTKEIKSTLDFIGLRELFARRQLVHIILEFLCQFFPQLVCGTGLALTTGYMLDSIPSKTLAIAFGHLLVGVSSKTLAHYGQLILSKKFQRYDEGSIGNIKRYGTNTPPSYNVSKIVSPVLLICGKNDLVSTLEDVNELSSKLPNLVEKYIVPSQRWSHNSHVWDKDAPKFVFQRVIDYLNRYRTK